jgi:hypothetical protein
VRYFVRIDDDPKSEAYGSVMGVMRFDPETAKPERWDKTEQAWIDHAEVLDFTGIGGANDHFEVPEEFAVRTIEGWKVGAKAPSVFEEAAGILKRSKPTSGPMRVVRWD